ncbi:NAD(P)H oxidoreductase YrkL @ Putative NADPH-quinone reductase (modulator of drug activity B) @ Flavodoxin 2 [Bathymodiolus thermophilus thioautotrophic gill symbiont]|uniref:NAD(P)H-dependent oxidoreductase n=1 Tax=Bathymodiolus thermophilus thioautotrophic gill symbiont TaxID=2360 RepID=UPI00192B7965|nr:NAD(P)H-dependent oxidoreductase [Bathymodiolus thermophilus thioautotrophic gill symbiont]CAB5503417.1 NAD(P)H oxidoreductase YrkL @ Putative NADPH-quinone reductase (modulator of drug activity B) @ Flavodoxin 2 [Bathymodiolus thermophilus thioautotrophic gill symbiont]
MKKILLVTAGYSIFDAKGQLNSFLSYLTDKTLSKRGYKIKVSDVTKITLDRDRELDKLLWADAVIYITPIMWFNMPAPLVQWLNEVLLYKKTFIITDEYGEGGQVPATHFMIVTTSNMKNSDLGKGFVLKNATHIDDLLQPLIMTNHYLSIRNQIPTFHADNVISGDTNWIESGYIKHLNKHF